MATLGRLHIVSMVIYLAGFVLFLVGLGSPHWYRSGEEFYGGVWKHCARQVNSTVYSCEDMAGQELHNNWVGTEVLLILSVFVGTVTGVLMLFIIDEIIKSNAMGTAYGMKSSLFTTSALLHLLTTTLIIVGSLMFPYESLNLSSGVMVTRDWAFNGCLTSAGFFAVNSFLQMGIMTFVTCTATKDIHTFYE